MLFRSLDGFNSPWRAGQLNGWFLMGNTNRASRPQLNPKKPVRTRKVLASRIADQHQLTFGKKSLPKVAPAPETLRGWTESARKSRNKS